MPKFPKITRKQLVGAGEALGETFAVAFVGSLLASGLDVHHIVDLAIYQKAAYSGELAVLALVSSVLKAWTGNGVQARRVRKAAGRG